MNRDIEMILRKEEEISAAVEARYQHIIEAQNRLQATSIAADREGECELDKAKLAAEITEELAAMRASRKALEERILEAPDQTFVRITNVSMSSGGQVAAGLVNVNGKYHNATVNIDNIEATSGGKCIAGIVEGVNLGNFF
jgi:hypothetical protein